MNPIDTLQLIKINQTIQAFSNFNDYRTNIAESINQTHADLTSNWKCCTVTIHIRILEKPISLEDHRSMHTEKWMESGIRSNNGEWNKNVSTLKKGRSEEE